MNPKPQYKDLTANQKAIAIDLLKEANPIFEGETNTQYLERLAQEMLYVKAINLYRVKKLNSADMNTIT